MLLVETVDLVNVVCREIDISECISYTVPICTGIEILIIRKN